MTAAERIYRSLLRLYPAEHRQAYGRLMLQHARDMQHLAQKRGRWQVLLVCLHLVTDGVSNAAKERLEAVMNANNSLKPVPWLSVLLACVPGLLIAASRRHADLLGPLLTIIFYLYLGLLVVAIALAWRQKRSFPVWALLPAGVLTWFLVFTTGLQLSKAVNLLRIPGLGWIPQEAGFSLLNGLLAVVSFGFLLRRQRVPRSAWIAGGSIVAGNLLVAVLYSLSTQGGGNLLRGIFEFFAVSGIGTLDGLMLAAVGLLAARQHGTLALLFVIGGYSYICLDSDYLFGYAQRDWAGLSAYLIAMVLLYLVVSPLALLRARTRLKRFLAVFTPLAAFLLLRMFVPQLVIEDLTGLRAGEIIFSINIVLVFLLGWALYSHLGKTKRTAQAVEAELQVTIAPG